MGQTPEEEEASTPSVPDLPIQKKVLHAGKGNLPKFADGTKVTLTHSLMTKYKLYKHLIISRR